MQGKAITRQGTYIASRAFPNYVKRWQALRDEQGFDIVSSWINGVGAADPELWLRISQQVASAERLVLYVEPQDFPLKGALIEVGMALAAGINVLVVAPGVEIEADTYRPLGSWLEHPQVTLVATMEEAMAGASKRQPSHC